MTIIIRKAERSLCYTLNLDDTPKIEELMGAYECLPNYALNYLTEKTGGIVPALDYMAVAYNKAVKLYFEEMGFAYQDREKSLHEDSEREQNSSLRCKNEKSTFLKEVNKRYD